MNGHKVKQLVLSLMVVVAPIAAEHAYADERARESGEAARAEACADQLLRTFSLGEVQNESLKRASRCLTRLTPERSALRGRQSLTERIRQLKRRIRRLRKQASFIEVETDPDGFLVTKINRLEEKLARLKERKKRKRNPGGKCGSQNSKAAFTFVNNSDYNLRVLIADGHTGWQQIGHLPFGKSDEVTISHRNAEILAEDTFDGEFTWIIEARIAGEDKRIERTVDLNQFPTRRPCTANFSFEFSNSDFPTPKGPYFVFGVDNGLSLYIGEEDELVGVQRCTFINGGLCPSPIVTFDKFSGPFETEDEAQLSLCSMITARGIWPLAAPCRKWYQLGSDQLWWGCTGLAAKGIAKHCPVESE